MDTERRAGDCAAAGCFSPPPTNPISKDPEGDPQKEKAPAVKFNHQIYTLNVTVRNGRAGQYIQLAKGSVLQEVQLCMVTAAHPTQLHKSSHKSFSNIWLKAQLLLLRSGM